MRLGDLAQKIRSKNAGPFWLSVDIFCGSKSRFTQIRDALKTEDIAQLAGVDADTIKQFDIADLNVIKFSFPRNIPQGSAEDRDMHGAQFAHLVAELDV